MIVTMFTTIMFFLDPVAIRRTIGSSATHARSANSPSRSMNVPFFLRNKLEPLQVSHQVLIQNSNAASVIAQHLVKHKAPLKHECHENARFRNTAKRNERSVCCARFWGMCHSRCAPPNQAFCKSMSLHRTNLIRTITMSRSGSTRLSQRGTYTAVKCSISYAVTVAHQWVGKV